jgi:hypothetical protein
MNLSALKTALENAGVSDDAYSFTSDAIGEVYRIQRIQDILGEGWEVYYSERGLKTGLLVFRSETDACEELLHRILRDPTTRRSTWPQSGANKFSHGAQDENIK